jgi:hypothetical protein
VITKFILEDGVKLSRYKQAKLIENYNTKGLVMLPEGLFVRSIQGLPAEKEQFTTVLIIGKL